MYIKTIHNVNGYYGYGKTIMYYGYRLKYMPYASAGVCFELQSDGTENIDLWSYQTKVCTIDGNGWLTCTGTYSQTTRKHIGAFLKEYGNGVTYFTAKKCYSDSIAYNIYTGEIKPL